MGCTQVKAKKLDKGSDKQDELMSKKQRPYIKTCLGLANLLKIYDMNTEAIGAGQFARVYHGKSKHDLNMEVAIKVIPKTGISDEAIDEIHNEVQILLTLDHPNIVKFYESYEEQPYFYIVMQYCSGGELEQRLVTKGENKGHAFTEFKAAQVIKPLLSALVHLKAQNIVHRDIKLENIMFDGSNQVRLADFGLSSQIIEQKKLSLLCGTPYYIAPEVLDKSYSYECDMWSLGVCLYKLITGQYPFNGTSISMLKSNIKQGLFIRPHECTDELYQFLQGCFKVNPSDRLTPEKALSHPWIRDALDVEIRHEEFTRKQPIDEQVISKLRAIHNISMLKKTVYNMLAKLCKADEIKALTQEFQKFDADGTGLIDYQELKQVFLKNKEADGSSEQDLKKLLGELDFNLNQRINYTEFIAATISVQHVQLTEEKIKMLFNQFDIDGDGHIGIEEIKQSLTKIGHDITQDELKVIMQQHDLTRDNLISIKEFKTMLNDLIPRDFVPGDFLV